MLWTDADFISAADLTSLDNEVLAVAKAEDITLEDTGTGSGVIHRAIEECGDALMKHMREFGGTWLGDGSVTANHYAGVFNTGLTPPTRSRVLLSQVVITGPVLRQWTPLKRWAVYWALMMFYRDAANRTQNDRYQDKADTYRTMLHGTYWAAARAAGLPVVQYPLPCPGALWEPEAGVWGTSNALAVAGPGNVSADYDVAITYVDGTHIENNESGPSARVKVTLTSGNVLKVTLDGLQPPTGVQPASTRALAYVAYGKATGWNVWAGPTGQTLRLQTATPVDIATASFTLPGNPATNTKAVGSGQYASKFMSFQNWNQRG